MIKSRPKSKPTHTAPVPRSTTRSGPTPRSASVAKSPLNNPYSQFGATVDLPNHGHFMMIYGEAGFGKTSLAAQFEKPLFVITHGEHGIYHLKEKDVVPKDIPVVELAPLFTDKEIRKHQFHPGWEKAIDILEKFAAGGHDRQTLVYDTTSGLESLCYQHGACKLYGGDMDCDKYADFMRGYAKSGEKFWKPEFIDGCLKCAAAGYDVILLAHCNSTSREANLAGKDFDRFLPDLQKAVWKYTKKDLQALLFLGERIHVEKMKGKEKPMSKVRFVGVCNETWYFAKNWRNLSTEIDQGTTPKETYKNIHSKLF